MKPIEYASLAELQRRDIDSNGLDHAASAELRRRGLAALTGTRRNPADRLRELERRKHPDYRTPRERLIALEARRGRAAGDSPRRLLTQLAAVRIAGGW